MIRPNKKEHELMRIEAERAAAFAADDLDALARLNKERDETATGPDIYTCLHCGKDFEGDHVELLLAGIMVIQDGETVRHQDFSIQDVLKQRAPGRKIKICRECTSGWAIPILEYLDMR